MKTNFFTFAALALILAACNNDNLNDDPVAALVTADIYETVSTRVNQEGTDWTDGDCIGITCISNSSYNNLPYVTNGDGNFTPEGTSIYFDTSDEITFRAYCPYDAAGNVFTVTTDATAQQDQSSIDFLFATGATGSSLSPTVSFTNKNRQGETDPTKDHSFHHCMSKITLDFKAGAGVTIPAEGSISYTLKGLVLKGTFDTANGQTATTATSPADVTMPGDLTSTIFFPQNVANIEMEILMNGNTYNTTLPVEDGKLQNGKEYHYDITINYDYVNVNATINEWNKTSDDIQAQL